MTLILSGTDGVSDVDGSAATPAVRGADANTGIFFPAADTIAFAEGGTEVARITNTAAWSFGASGTATGTSGQVLTSAGSSAAPAWANPAVTAPAGTTGQVQINNAGAFGAVSSGTTGQILTSQGAGAAPVFAAPAAGGSLILLQAITASNTAEVDLTEFSSTYDDYVVFFHNAQSQSTPDNRLACRLRVGGVWRESADYAWVLHELRTNSGTYVQTQTASANTIQVTRSMFSIDAGGAEASCAGLVWLFGANQTRKKAAMFESYQTESDNSLNISCRGHGTWKSNDTVLSGIRFLMSGSPLATGTFRLYGIKKS
jgi:hypothetical protein